MATPAFTIIIPAYNEARVIGRTLAHMRDAALGGVRPQIIVVCNGCTDDTAAVVRAACPAATVIEEPVGSKTGAINRALDTGPPSPVIVVDADVIVPAETLAALVDVLRQDGVMAASPTADLRVDRSGALVRAYYRVWAANPYLTSGVGGSGVYGLSEAGVRQLGRLPRLIADDTFVRRSFPLAAQRRIPQTSIVRAPERLADLVACEARWQAGNREMRAYASTGHGSAPADRKDGTTLDRIVFLAIKALGRVKLWADDLRGGGPVWHRDRAAR